MRKHILRQVPVRNISRKKNDNFYSLVDFGFTWYCSVKSRFPKISESNYKNIVYCFVEFLLQYFVQQQKSG